MDKNNEFRKYAVHHLGMSGNTIDGYAQRIDNMTQYVIDERPGNFRAIDVFTRLISDRIIFLGMGIDDQIANLIRKPVARAVITHAHGDRIAGVDVLPPRPEITSGVASIADLHLRRAAVGVLEDQDAIAALAVRGTHRVGVPFGDPEPAAVVGGFSPPEPHMMPLARIIAHWQLEGEVLLAFEED